MSAPEIKEALKEVKQTSTKTEKKVYVPFTPKKEPKEDEINLEDFYDDKAKKQESKEKQENSLELAEKNFRVEDTKNRKEITDPNGVKVKENPKWDVREYLEGGNKWEQLFTYDSALRETKKAGKKLPPSWTRYRDIIEGKYAWNYQDFLEWEKITFPGVRENDWFQDIDLEFGLHCADGSYFNGYKYKWFAKWGKKNDGYSVRCLKD